MNGRFMRVLVFFDLPVETKAERREYARFRRALVKDGFLMMQESVYCKLALNPTAARSIMDGVRSRRPHKGLVQMLFGHRKAVFPHGVCSGRISYGNY